MRLPSLIFLVLSLSACTNVGLIASPSEQFSTSESFRLKASPPNFVDTVIEVGQGLEYKYSGVDRSKNLVRLTDNASIGIGVLIGKTSNINLEVRLEPDGHTVAIQLDAFGNFKTANHEKINQRLSELKAALQARLR